MPGQSLPALYSPHPHQLMPHPAPTRPPYHSTRPINKPSARTTGKDISMSCSWPSHHNKRTCLGLKPAQSKAKLRMSPGAVVWAPGPSCTWAFHGCELLTAFSFFFFLGGISEIETEFNLQPLHDPHSYNYAGCRVANWLRRDHSRNHSRNQETHWEATAAVGTEESH